MTLEKSNQVIGSLLLEIITEHKNFNGPQDKSIQAGLLKQVKATIDCDCTEEYKDGAFYNAYQKVQAHLKLK
jgi:hypothetical protein